MEVLVIELSQLFFLFQVWNIFCGQNISKCYSPLLTQFIRSQSLNHNFIKFLRFKFLVWKIHRRTNSVQTRSYGFEAYEWTCSIDALSVSWRLNLFHKERILKYAEEEMIQPNKCIYLAFASFKITIINRTNSLKPYIFAQLILKLQIYTLDNRFCPARVLLITV